MSRVGTKFIKLRSGPMLAGVACHRRRRFVAGQRADRATPISRP